MTERTWRTAALAGAVALVLAMVPGASSGAAQPFGHRAPALLVHRDAGFGPGQSTSQVTTYPALSPGDHVETLTVGTMVRSFILHVPPGPVVANRPLVLVFHAATVSAATTERVTDFAQVADQTGEVVAFMQGYKNTWNEGAGQSPAALAHIDDVGFTAAAVPLIEQLVPFDHNRIVATGFSNGALMVEYLGCQLAGVLNLIVPVEGELAVVDSDSCAPARPISLYEVHATADDEIPYNGGYFHGVYGGTTVLSAPANVARWAQLDQCATPPVVTTPSPSLQLTAYSTCHGGATATLRTIIGGGHAWGSNIGVLVSAAAAALPS